MHHQRPAQSQRDTLGLSRDSSTGSQGENIVPVHASCHLERPQGTLPVMQAGERINEVPPIHQHLTTSFDQMHGRSRSLPAPQAVGAALIVELTRRGLWHGDEARTAEAVDGALELVRLQFRVDAVEAREQLQHPAVLAGGDGLAQVGAVGGEFEPGGGARLRRVDGGERFVLAEQGAQEEDVVVELGGGGEVGGGCWDDASWAVGDGAAIAWGGGGGFGVVFEFVTTGGGG